MNDYAFGNFLYTLRTEKGLSQSQLGEMLGVTNKAVSKWETGSAKPNTNLIPKIAEILGVTVEELFSCKRLNNQSEFDKIKQYLQKQKTNYAILSSAFFAFIAVLPLLLFEFVIVVMGFELSDDVLGPLGSMAFIFSFVISLTAFIIYRNNFKRMLTPDKLQYSNRFLNFIKIGVLIATLSILGIATFTPLLYTVILDFSYNHDYFKSAGIFLSVAALIFIICIGSLIFFLRLKRILKIKFSEQKSFKGNAVPFSHKPVWYKICRISSIILFPICFNLLIIGFFNESYMPIKHLFMLVFSGSLIPTALYDVYDAKNKK